jgi:radical SAM superfamily enzyme YgiQ (UPF0313 family)
MKTISSLIIVLIKPSKYDDDGYVIRYVRGVLPSNTLACLYSLTNDFVGRWKKDYGISVTVKTYDDLVEAVPIKRLASKNRGATKVVAALVGVQSNQFPRASDIAKKLTDAGIKTLIGGFHVSGILAMFDKPTSDIQELMNRGITIVQGEAEGVWESILSDIVAGKEKPLYRMEQYPDISESPTPQPSLQYMNKFAIPDLGTMDCSRGCPFNCTFCTVVNVQGHRMRFRGAKNVITTVRDNYKQGIKQYFFTDDNFSRNPNWEQIFDGLIHLREVEGIDVTFMMQVDMKSNTIKNFVKKASRAGCTQVFIGLESLNPKNLEAVKKNQNKVEDFITFIESWHEMGIKTHVGYIIGFPFDTPESIRDDIEKMKNDLKVDQASFFILTPLPGSMDHYTMVMSGGISDPDLNKYDSFHTVTPHPSMSAEEIYQAYNDAWESFYSYDNMKNILMRTGRKGYWGVFRNLMWYKNSLLEPQHPMIAGLVRRKDRLDIRPGTPTIGFWKFYFTRAQELWSGLKKRIRLFFELEELWLLTRKPDDPTFKLVADFTLLLSDARARVASIDFSTSYTKWCEDIATILAPLKEKVQRFSETSQLKGSKKKQFLRLVNDIHLYLDRFSNRDYHIQGCAHLSNYLSSRIQVMEEYILKQVARRRKYTQLWKLSYQRIKERKFIRLTMSLPTIVICASREFIMSSSFMYHLFSRAIK